MTDNKEEVAKDILTIDYNESNPVFKKIQRQFKNQLKEKYQCEDYDSLLNYVFDYVFKKKLEKSKCIESLNPLFNNKASGMIDYLWKITKEAEKENENSLDSDEDNRYHKYNKGGKQWQDKNKTKGRKNFDNRQKFSKKNQRERSRSYSREKNDYENYESYPMQQKGFYPPKGRFGPPMMPMGGGYPFYPPQMYPPPYAR